MLKNNNKSNPDSLDSLESFNRDHIFTIIYQNVCLAWCHRSYYSGFVFFKSWLLFSCSIWCLFKVSCSFSEYYGVVTIPAGARSIRVVELNTSSSYLAIRDTQRRYYLNGHWTVDWPGRHPIAGAIFEYKRPYNRPESLISTGPTNETLIIEVGN